MQHSTASSQSKSIESSPKLSQLLQQFYSKTAHLIVECRFNVEPADTTTSTTATKVNKWFQSPTRDSIKLKQDLKFWKSYFTSHDANLRSVPPLFIDVFLDLSKFREGDQLVLITRGGHEYGSAGGERKNVLQVVSQDVVLVDADFSTCHHGIPVEVGHDEAQDKTRTASKILLETWQLTLSHDDNHNYYHDNAQMELPVVYKNGIMFFNNLHSLLLNLPVHQLLSHNEHSRHLPLSYRLSSERKTPSTEEFGLDSLHSTPVPALGEQKLPSVLTPLGPLNLHVTYRLHCQFERIPSTSSRVANLRDEQPTNPLPILHRSRHAFPTRASPARHAFPTRASPASYDPPPPSFSVSVSPPSQSLPHSIHRRFRSSTHDEPTFPKPSSSIPPFTTLSTFTTPQNVFALGTSHQDETEFGTPPFAISLSSLSSSPTAFLLQQHSTTSTSLPKAQSLAFRRLSQTPSLESLTSSPSAPKQIVGSQDSYTQVHGHRVQSTPDDVNGFLDFLGSQYRDDKHLQTSIVVNSTHTTTMTTQHHPDTLEHYRQKAKFYATFSESLARESQNRQHKTRDTHDRGVKHRQEEDDELVFAISVENEWE